MHGHAQVWEWLAGAAAVAAVLAGWRGLGRRRGGPPARDGRRGGAPAREPRRGPRAPRGRADAGHPPTGAAQVRVRPRPREIWWAEVPFEDGPGSKDRPCLVVRVGASSATVLKITSKHHAERPGVLPLPPGTVGDRARRASWLETDEPREVPLHAFRRRVGAVAPGLWSRVQAQSRGRDGLQGRR